jgi:hypothetical protein
VKLHPTVPASLLVHTINRVLDTQYHTTIPVPGTSTTVPSTYIIIPLPGTSTTVPSTTVPSTSSEQQTSWYLVPVPS